MAQKSEAEMKQELIGFCLRNLRNEKGEKLINVHNATGISISTINEIENGKQSRINLETLSKLAAYYNQPLDKILNPEEKT